ncbi:MAG TPA: hypothetical protein VIB08_00750, partial [Thermoanaerobaculia bacterium]
MNNILRSLFPPDAPKAERAGYFLLLLYAAAAPFPWGGVTPLGHLILAGVAASALALSATTPQAPARELSIVIAAAGGIVILGLFQLLPLPEGLVRALSPNALRSYEEAS